MPQQTIGSRYEAKLRAQERLKPFSEADDFRLLNEAIERNTKSDPNIAINRQLTREDKEWTSRALDIDTQAAQFAEFILEGDTKDKTIRDDLNIKEINHAKKALPGLMESLHAMNPEGDPRTTNYINAMNMKFSTALQTAEKSAFLKDSLGNVQELIEDLGDDERLAGQWNLKDTQFFIDNVKTLSKSYLDASGEDVDDHFQPLIQMHDDKRAVFSALTHFTKPGSQANANVKDSPKALANLNEAVRLMRTSQNENIEEIKGLLDEIPKFIGENANDAKKAGIISAKDTKDKEDASLDSQIRLQMDNFSKQSEGKDKLDDKLMDVINNYSGVNVPIGDWADEKVQKDALPILKRQFMDMLVGVDDFNPATWNDESYAEDYDLQDEVDAGNIDRVLVYFTDPSNKNITAEDRNQGITTIGEARIKRIKSGNKNQTKNAQNRFRSLLKVITLLDPKVVTDPGLRNPTKEDSYRQLEALGVTIAR